MVLLRIVRKETSVVFCDDSIPFYIICVKELSCWLEASSGTNIIKELYGWEM